MDMDTRFSLIICSIISGKFTSKFSSKILLIIRSCHQLILCRYQYVSSPYARNRMTVKPSHGSWLLLQWGEDRRKAWLIIVQYNAFLTSSSGNWTVFPTNLKSWSRYCFFCLTSVPSFRIHSFFRLNSSLVFVHDRKKLMIYMQDAVKHLCFLEHLFRRRIIVILSTEHEACDSLFPTDFLLCTRVPSFSAITHHHNRNNL